MDRNDTISVDEIKDYLKDVIAGGKIAEDLLGSEGWSLLKKTFDNLAEDIRAKDDYDTLEDFKVDRKALAIIQEIINGLESIVADSDQAIIEYNKLTIDEAQTPIPLIDEEIDQAEEM